MAKVKLKIRVLSQTVDNLKEDTINAENIWEIIQRIESKYPRDYYTFAIFLNGVSVRENDESKSLRDGDDVVLIPIFSGG